MGSVIEAAVDEIGKLPWKLRYFMLSDDDKAQLLDSVGMEIEEQTKERIDITKTDPQGRKWDPWKESTRRYMQKHFPKAKLLWRNPAEGLLNSIEHQAGGRDSVIVGSSKEYAGYLQEGTRKMVARKFLGLGASDIAALQYDIAKFLMRKIS